MIEFEKVQLIRKRAKTTLRHCAGCGAEADFVELKAAARLFDTRDGDLAAFIDKHAVHYEAVATADVDICISSLLAVMRAKKNGNGMRLLE